MCAWHCLSEGWCRRTPTLRLQRDLLLCRAVTTGGRSNQMHAACRPKVTHDAQFAKVAAEQRFRKTRNPIPSEPVAKEGCSGCLNSKQLLALGTRESFVSCC